LAASRLVRATALDVGESVSIASMQPVDLVICGSVAINRRGVRLGKGADYSDVEVALLVEARLISEQTTIVTTAEIIAYGRSTRSGQPHKRQAAT
jgi:5-formyltetrahydrofolate cyclo-ligase